jgi:hypothetical protein
VFISAMFPFFRDSSKQKDEKNKTKQKKRNGISFFLSHRAVIFPFKRRFEWKLKQITKKGCARNDLHVVMKGEEGANSHPAT